MPVNYDDELRLAYLRAAVRGQADDEAEIAAYRSFWAGEQGIKLTDRQKEYLLGRGDGITPESFGNVCRRVVSVPKDRLEIEANGIAPADPDAAEYADAVTDWWNINSLAATQKEVYEAALRDRTAAVVVGWDADGKAPTFTPNLVYDGKTGLVRFHYDSDGNLLYASKRWRVWDPLTQGETGKVRLNIYLPDAIERHEEAGGSPSGWRMLEPEEVRDATAGSVTQNPQPWVDRQGQPLGVPVIPFENPGGSELEDVVIIQKLLNHSLGEFDIAVDFHNAPHLWAAGIELPLDSNGNPYVPEFGPKKMFTVVEGGQVGRIEPADLERMFRSGVMSWVHILSIVKGWPLFLLDRSAQPPSGVALKIMEASLIAQISDKQAVFGGAWRQCFEMGRRLHRLATGDELTGEIAIGWKQAETQDELAETEAQVKRWEGAQVPVLTRWRESGYTEDQIDQMMQDKQREDDLGLVDFVTGIQQ